MSGKRVYNLVTMDRYQRKEDVQCRELKKER